MRITVLSIFCLLGIAVATERFKPSQASTVPDRVQTGEIKDTPTNLPAAQVRTPDTVIGKPGEWPEQGKRRRVDVTELKSEAQELAALTQALPSQIEKIGSGQLPKELIENLKKIEKLAKHIRGEVT